MKIGVEQKEKHNTTQEILDREGNLMVEEFLIANQARFIQETVEAEVDEFLGRKRYDHGSSEKGYRNGVYSKQIKLPEAQIAIKKPTCAIRSRSELYHHDYSNTYALRNGMANYFDFYNHQRYHQALNYQTPAEVYFNRPCGRSRS